jgi:hypothetical protein
VGDRARLLYTLKRLVTPPQWAGQIAHEVAATALEAVRAGRGADPDALVTDAVRRARRAVADARAGLPALDPRRYVGFEALAYGDDPGDAWWDEAVGAVEAACRGVLAHPLMARLAEVPARIVEVERHVRTGIDDVTLLVALDVLVRDGRGGLVVVDWKTGAAHDPAEVDAQLAVYALSVSRRFRVAPEKVLGVHASTRDAAFRRVAFDADALAAATARVRASAAAMTALLPDPSVDRLDADALPQLDAGAPACARCRYRRACDR